MKRRAVIESAIGETRAAVYEGRRLAEFHLRRHIHAPNDIKTSPQPRDIFTGRITKVDPSVAGAFVDLGTGPIGLLKFASRKTLPQLTEGLLLDVEISRGSIGDKGPNLLYAGPASCDKAGPVVQHSLQDYLSLLYPDITFDQAMVSTLDDAAERQIAVKGGGRITFDQTQALLAIDVDKGEAATPLESALAASQLIAAQLRLRGLGGLVIIDFPNLRQPKHRTAVLKTLETAFAQDSAIVKIAPMSRFGCVEMTRAMASLSLDALLNDRYGRPTLDTRAIRAIRRLEREGAANAGAKLTLHVPQDILDWLETTPLNWREQLTDRIGARFEVKLGTMQSGDGADVSADR